MVQIRIEIRQPVSGFADVETGKLFHATKLMEHLESLAGLLTDVLRCIHHVILDIRALKSAWLHPDPAVSPHLTGTDLLNGAGIMIEVLKDVGVCPLQMLKIELAGKRLPFKFGDPDP